MLQIENLLATVGRKRVCKGIGLEGNLSMTALWRFSAAAMLVAACSACANAGATRRP